MKDIQTTKIAIFKGRKIRKIIHNNEWWFSVVDVIKALTENERPCKYWSDLKNKLIDEGYFEVSEKIGQLKLKASDGKMRETDCANVETMFRVIQSIPSPKAEPFKRWLARVGYERVKEIEDPELARMKLNFPPCLDRGLSREKPPLRGSRIKKTAVRMAWKQ